MTTKRTRNTHPVGSVLLTGLGGVVLLGAVFATLGGSSEADDGARAAADDGSGADAVDDVCADRGQAGDLDGLTESTRHALLAAIDAAAADGIEMSLTSGYRTCADQQRIFDEHIAEHGSIEEASVWALPPAESNHVRGIAVDVGPGPAADWLELHGPRYGLCRTMSWEWWHFEYAETWAASESCPEPAPGP